MIRLRSHLAERLAWSQRERTCRQRGHSWTDRSDPVCCDRCGCTRTFRLR